MRIFFLTVIFLLVTNNIQSQDLIIKRTGEELKVTIIEINTTNLKYNNPGFAVSNTISLSEISLVIFKNGEKMDFVQFGQSSEKLAKKINKAKISAGTAISLVSKETLSSKATKVGAAFKLNVKDDVFADDGKTVIFASGREVIATITKLEKNQNLSKKAIISFKVDCIEAIDGQLISVSFNNKEQSPKLSVPKLAPLSQLTSIRLGNQYEVYTERNKEIEVISK